MKIKGVFHRCNWMCSAFSIDFIGPTPEFQTPLTFLLVDKTQSVDINFLSYIARTILVIKFSGFAEIFTFSTAASMVSDLVLIAHYTTSSLM